MKLMNFIFPKGDVVSQDDLYFKTLKNLSYLFKGNLYVAKDDKVSFDTFYNAFPVKPWSSIVKLTSLYFTLKGEGDFIAKVTWKRYRKPNQIVFEDFFSLDKKEFSFKVNNRSNFSDGILVLELIAKSSNCYINGGCIGIEKNSERERDIKLGIVITHFNRKEQVIPAIHRISHDLISDDDLGRDIQLVVVDNSRNIGSSEVPENVTVLKNENLGGSGGFTRGFIHLKKSKNITHCLFMDDDASCEIESIKRAITFLSLSPHENQAVSGALLRELEPSKLIEKGAIFDGMARPLSHNLDMSITEHLLIASDDNTKCDYGAWWFFAFPIANVENLAFPFFVRGDDIQFSLMNNFNISSLIGVACLGDDFGLKSNPMTRYLDVRHTLVQNISVVPLSPLKLLSNTLSFFFAALFSFNYLSARATSLALRDFCKGKSFWLENMDMRKIRTEISSLGIDEKLEAISISKHRPIFVGQINESRLRKLIRILTIQGMILPKILLFKRPVYQYKSSSVDLCATFRAKEILHYYDEYQIGYIARRSRTKFLKELFVFSKYTLKFLFNYKKLKKEYDSAIKQMTSFEFWENTYK